MELDIVRDDNENRGLSLKPVLNAHGPTLVWGIWVVWGFACMGLAHTGIVNWPWFAGFRDAMKSIVPSVNHIPPADAIDPVVSSSFLALIWASSPMAWLLFNQVPIRRLFAVAAWNAPLTTRIKWAMFVIAICAFMAFWFDFGSRRSVNLLMARDVFRFSILASLVSAAPWFATVFLTGWIKRVKEISVNQ